MNVIIDFQSLKEKGCIRCNYNQWAKSDEHITDGGVICENCGETYIIGVASIIAKLYDSTFTKENFEVHLKTIDKSYDFMFKARTCSAGDYLVMFTKYEPDAAKRLQYMKYIRECFDFDLKTAKEIVDRGYVIESELTEEVAKEVAETLNKLGAETIFFEKKI